MPKTQLIRKIISADDEERERMNKQHREILAIEQIAVDRAVAAADGLLVEAYGLLKDWLNDLRDPASRTIIETEDLIDRIDTYLGYEDTEEEDAE